MLIDVACVVRVKVRVPGNVMSSGFTTVGADQNIFIKNTMMNSSIYLALAHFIHSISSRWKIMHRPVVV